MDLPSLPTDRRPVAVHAEDPAVIAKHQAAHSDSLASDWEQDAPETDWSWKLQLRSKLGHTGEDDPDIADEDLGADFERDAVLVVAEPEGSLFQFLVGQKGH